MLRVQQQPRLSNVSLSICDHCNLNCKGCDVFSPVASEHFAEVQSVKNDLARMGAITGGKVTKMSVLGGEPLLHPDLLEILKATRASFPETLIQLISNGILLLQQKDEFWNCCRENDICIEITKYPIDLKHEQMKKLAQDNNVKFNFYGNTESIIKKLYKMPMDVDGRQEPKTAFWNCYHVNICALLTEGKLYPCSPMPNAQKFNQKFGTKMNLEEEDYLDIYKINNYQEILRFLTTPKPFCRYCKTTSRTFGHTWERSKREMEEWT